MTYPEILLWNELKQKKLAGYDFDRQRPIDEYIVDFYCKDLSLAIEVDGTDHDSDEVYLKDQLRQQRMEDLGISFLRFTNLEILKERERVLDEIRGWISAKEERK